MRVLLVMGMLFTVGTASKFAELLLKEWETHKLTHNLNFPTVHEDQYRLDIYIDTRINIAKHNAKFARREVGFKMGENQFTHMMKKEVADIMNGFNRTARQRGEAVPKPNPTHIFVRSERDIPTEIDWRKKGAVTPVKDQGFCGSCYAFAAVAALEGQHFLKKNKLVSLSEQNLVDCSFKQHNEGCGGGYARQCYEYVQANDGIDTEAAYPYLGIEHRTCEYNVTAKGATDSGYVFLPVGDEYALMEAVATIGPISVAIDTLDSFMDYKEGIYFDLDCSSTSMDHAVTVVGYGGSPGEEYWLVKNSWGTKWGEEGYVKMSRFKDNNCGIATQATYPIVH